MTGRPDVPSLLLGCHLSIARGLDAAVRRADELGNSALQLFTHSPTTWGMRAISSDEVRRFRQSIRAATVAWTVVHTAYLVNLASPDPTLRRRSVETMIEEVERAAVLGANAVVTHVGHAMGAPRAAAIERAAESLAHILTCPAFRRAPRLDLLLENTAGAGTALGGSFADLGELLVRLDAPPQLGVCLDTCHAIAAGADLRSTQAVEDTVRHLEDAVGPGRLRLIHLNDSVFPIGSRRDRHAHIGQGVMGEEGVSAVLAHPKLCQVPVILETPKTFDDGSDADPVNLAKVRALHAAATSPST